MQSHYRVELGKRTLKGHLWWHARHTRSQTTEPKSAIATIVCAIGRLTACTVSFSVRLSAHLASIPSDFSTLILCAYAANLLGHYIGASLIYANVHLC